MHSPCQPRGRTSFSWSGFSACTSSCGTLSHTPCQTFSGPTLRLVSRPTACENNDLLYLRCAPHSSFCGKHTHTHVRTYSLTHTYTHLHTLTHTYTHTHTLSLSLKTTAAAVFFSIFFPLAACCFAGAVGWAEPRHRYGLSPGCRGPPRFHRSAQQGVDCMHIHTHIWCKGCVCEPWCRVTTGRETWGAKAG